MHRDEEDPRFTEVVKEVHEPPKAGYFTTERSYYAQPPGTGPAIIVEKEKPRWSICMCVLITLFVILLLIVIIALIAFFASGAANRVVSTTKTVQTSPYTQRLYADTSGHLDLVQREVVHGNLKSGDRQCLLETGSEELYKTEHIVTARYFPMENVYHKVADNVNRPLHPEEFQEMVRRLGVSDDCSIVIYDHGSNQGRATGAWWIFRVYGYPRVSVMQGGLDGWKSLGLGTVQDLPPPTRGDFLAGYDPFAKVSYEDLVNLIERNRNIATNNRPYQLLDARDYDYYSGAKNYHGAPIPGRIVDSVNVPANVLSQGGTFSDFDILREYLAEKGVRSDGSIQTIIYGNAEMDGSELYFVLHQMGYNVRLYDGGWAQWAKLQGNQQDSLIVTP